MKKLLFVGLVCLLLVSGFVIYQDYLNKKPIPINCNEYGVVYLLPSEKEQASEIANRINGIVVIPEENIVIGRSEYLDCPISDLMKEEIF